MHTVRDYALSIVEAVDLAGKLQAPPMDLRDEERGPALRIASPRRPPELAIVAAKAVKVPSLLGMQDISQRRRILHALANHELQAAELFAWTLLAFPDAPTGFRRGLLSILGEEQEHCKLYLDRLAAFGGRFGDYFVTGHFWRRMDDVKSPLDFVCVMGLVFENANLDFAKEYADAARDVGDEETARAIERVHADEVRHVAFAWRWFQRWKAEGQSSWQAFVERLHFPLSPARSRGATLDRQARQQAGFDEDFIDQLELVGARRPDGTPR